MILDTSVLVNIDRGVDDERLEKLDERGPHKISSVTRAEFFTGVNLREDTEENRARVLLSEPEEIPLEGEIAEKAGELIAEKQEKNLSIGLNDIYIAATALVEGEKVLTADPSDFREISEIKVEEL